MITISLNEIRAHSPCEDGWKKVLASKGGTSADMGAQFPMTDILESNALDDALWCLRCRPEHSGLWRKLAVWCARQVESQMTDERSRNALAVAWRHSEGLATDAELDAAWDAAWDAAEAAWDAAGAARGAARDAAGAAWDAAWGAAWDAAWAARGAAWDAAGAARGAAWAARGAAWAAAGAARGAAWGAAWAARGAAWAAQKTKLIEILTAGEWVDSATAQEEQS